MVCLKPKIFFLIRELDIGGAQRQLVELAIGLRRMGWQVTVATFYSGGPLESELARADIRLVSLEKRSRWDVIAFVRRLVRLLRSESPDIAHGYMDVANVLLTVVRPFVGKPHVIWGVRASNMDNARYDMTWRVSARIAAWLSRFADLIIFNSHAGREHHVRDGLASRRAIVIPNGIDIRRFRPDAEARARMREQWNIEPSEHLVGLVARLDPMKDHANFLRAAAAVTKVDTSVRFVCVGSGPGKYRDHLVALAQRLGLQDMMIWAGARNDVERVYNALDVSVCASSFGEGFSNAIAEAMATGVPCVVTDVGDAARIVGTLGHVVAPGDSNALATGIVAALHTNPAERFRLRDAIVNEYSTSALCERTAGELQHALRPDLRRAQVHTRLTP